jgi:hypothetical protein
LPPLGRVTGHDLPPSELELLDEPELEPPELKPDELELDGLPELDPEALELDPVPVPLELEPPAPEPEPEDVPELELEPELEPAEESAGPPPAASSPLPRAALPWDDPQAIVANRANAQTVHVVLLIACGIVRSRSGGQRRNPSRKPSRKTWSRVIVSDGLGISRLNPAVMERLFVREAPPLVAQVRAGARVRVTVECQVVLLPPDDDLHAARVVA